MPHKNAFIGNLFYGIASPCTGQDGLNPHSGNSSDGSWGQSVPVTEHSQGPDAAAMKTDPVLWPWRVVGSPHPPHSCLPPALCCWMALLCLATPPLTGVCTSRWRIPAAGQAGPAAISSLAGGQPQAPGVGGQPGPSIQHQVDCF